MGRMSNDMQVKMRVFKKTSLNVPLPPMPIFDTSSRDGDLGEGKQSVKEGGARGGGGGHTADDNEEL